MENTEKNQSNGGEKKSGYHRHYRHRKSHRAPSDAQPQNAAPASETVTEEAVSNGAPESRGNAQKNNKKNHNNHNRRHRNGDNRHRRDGYETRGPIDPYQDAEETAAELAALRAMIVIKAADETQSTEGGPEAELVPNGTKADASDATGTNTVREELPEKTTETNSPAETTDAEDLPLPPAPEIESPIEDSEPPIEVVGVRFRSAGKIYYFDPQGKTAKKGEHAIVETARGPEFGDVALPNRMVSPKDVVAPLRPILRIATKEDIAQNEENREKEARAFEICRTKILEHKLEMKLIEAQYAFDNSKLLFYFTSDGRVDFRDLVKDLASVFRTRIELRQIGIRDEAKMLGGLGACGRPLCCSTFLPDFAQVSIKMAKEQNLSLNSAKISGVCGRLMCCLRYESEVYAMENKLTPSVGTPVKTEDGVGTVTSANPISGNLTVTFRNGQETTVKTYHRDTVTVVDKDQLPTQAVGATVEKSAESNGTKRGGFSRNASHRGVRKSDGEKKETENT